MWNVAFTMARRQRRQAAGTGDPPSEGLVGFGQSQLGRITARKVPKTVSPRVVRILAVDHALFLLSSGYLLEWYWVHRPLPNWVLFAAAGAFVLSIALGVALRTVRSSRRELALFRARARSVWTQSGSATRRHLFLILALGPVAGYLVWFLLPRGAGHDDITILALVTIETVLFLAYANFVSGRRRLRKMA